MDFDDVLNLEKKFYNEGFREGQAQSTKRSYKEGKEYGLQVGFQKYVIIGQIQALIELAQTGVLGELSEQARSQLRQLVELLNGIKIDNEYGNVIETEKLIIKIRNKIRVLTNLLPTKRGLNLQMMDDLGMLVCGLEEEKKNAPSIGNLNDDGMW